MPAPIYFRDTSGQAWLLTVNDTGDTVGLTQVFGVTSVTGVFVKDVLTAGRVWKVFVRGPGDPDGPAGELAIIQSSASTTRLQLYVASPNGTLYAVQFSAGQMQTNLTCLDAPQVGTIYNPPGYLPPFTQPGGPNTQTRPSQQTGELTALWILPCGHGVNNFEVASGTACGTRVALVLCPYCSYLVRIISPFDAIYDDAHSIIFA